MDIRTKTQIIIWKDYEFLVGYVIYSDETRWSSSPWDAWGTRNREQAWEVAEKVGGVPMLWNPIVGQMAIL